MQQIKITLIILYNKSKHISNFFLFFLGYAFFKTKENVKKMLMNPLVGKKINFFCTVSSIVIGKD